MSIEFEVSEVVPAIPEIVYAAWINSIEHSKMIGSSANVSDIVGENFEIAS